METANPPNTYKDSLFQISNDPILLINQAGTILDVNPKALDFYGYSRAEFIGLKVFNLHPDNLQEESKARFEEVWHKGFSRFNILTVLKNGEKREVEVSASLTRDQEDPFILSIIRDYTEQHEALREISRLSQFPEQNPFPVIRVGPDFKLEYGNQASRALRNQLNINKGDLLPQDWQQMVTELCKNGNCVNYKQNFEYGVGERTFLFSVSTVQETGQVYIYGQDITNLKNNQEQLKARNDELSVFIYKTHHDLKNPVATLLGVVQLAEMEVTDEQALAYLRMIHQSASKLDDVLVNLIKVLEIKDGRTKLAEVDLKALIEEVFDKVKTYDQSDRVTFRYTIEPELRTIRTEKNTLFYILENLMGNGLKYRDEEKDEPRVQLDVSRSANQIVFRIADNGVGIDPAAQSRIFEVFYRASNKAKGTGLGLYLVKKGVEKLNGQLDFQSKPGEGTAFEIRLPDNDNG